MSKNEYRLKLKDKEYRVWRSKGDFVSKVNISILIGGIFVFFSLYTSKVLGLFNLLELWPWIIALVVFIAAKTWYKILITSVVERY